MIDADVAYAKVGNIQRCLRRIKDVTALDPARLDDIDVQDILPCSRMKMSWSQNFRNACNAW
jgi:hypothetical protein